MSKKFLVLLITLLVLSSCVFVVGDYGGVTLSAWTDDPPTVDGSMVAGEWDVADSADFTTVGTCDFNGTIWVMNDAENLYIFVMFEEIVSMGSIRIMFDNDNDEDEWDPGDDAIYYGWHTDGGFYDKHFSSWPNDGVQDGEGAAYGIPGLNFVEFSHPLDSGDPEDFSLAIGDTVGFQIFIDDATLGEGYWPPEAQTTNDIIIAGPQEFPVGGELLPLCQLSGVLIAIGIVVSLILSYNLYTKNHFFFR
jgi:hypothetical protein